MSNVKPNRWSETDRRTEMKDFFSNKKKLRGYREFLYILPFLILVLVFSYYPLYGWVYAFFDYKPPASLSWDKFVGLKWFKSMVENDVKLKQLLMVIRNTFAMSGISLLFSWFPMIFAIIVFLCFKVNNDCECLC